jgi:hypothetical protein
MLLNYTLIHGQQNIKNSEVIPGCGFLGNTWHVGKLRSDDWYQVQ